MVIGLSVNHKEGLSCISNAYVNAVIKAGGSPVLIPLTNDVRVLEEIISGIDGLILSGGGDIDSSFFNEPLHPSVESTDNERDMYDISLVRMAAERQIPILGICRGHQVINVAFGGNLIQDIPTEVSSTLQHSQTQSREIGTHEVSVKSDSLLSHILQSERVNTNSFHHQAIRNVADGFIATAFTDDGVNEAIESSEGKSITGVQWHPENMAVAGNETMTKLFNHIVNEADIYKTVKDIHRDIFTIDSHCDAPMQFYKGANIGKDDELLQMSIPKMEKGMLDAVFMVAYLKQGERDENTSLQIVNKTAKILSELKKQIENNSATAGMAISFNDLKRLKQEGKKAIFTGIENGYAIGKDIRNIKKFADMGVSYITLSHNGNNDICDSGTDTPEHNGLSDFGKDVVKEMNRLGIMVDISHTSEKTSFDVLEISKYPIIASHSSAKALCDHPRNISDKLMKAIAAKGGVVQVCLYTGFLRKSGKVTIKDAVDHIDYIVKTVGIDHVGIGSDFDGGGGFTGLNGANEMPQLTIELLRRGYKKAEIEKIWGGNLMRVMNAVQQQK